MAWVKIVPPEEAEGELKEQYEKLQQVGVSRFVEVVGVFTHHPKVLWNLVSSSPPAIYNLDGVDPVLEQQYPP